MRKNKFQLLVTLLVCIVITTACGLEKIKTKKTNEEIILNFFKGKKYEEYVKVIMKANLSLRKRICFLLEEKLLEYKEEI